MNSYTNTGVAHAELLLVTCFEKENPPGNKNLFLQCVFCVVPCSLQYLITMPKSVLRQGEGEGRAIERVPGHPELSHDPSLHHPFGFRSPSAVPSSFEKSGRCPCFIPQLMPCPSVLGTEDKELLCRLSSTATTAEGGSHRGDSGLEEKSV
jgi:hypothetical protein